VPHLDAQRELKYHQIKMLWWLKGGDQTILLEQITGSIPGWVIQWREVRVFFQNIG
jgi:hypothetical protein